MYLVVTFQLYLSLVHAYKCFKVKPFAEAGVGENEGINQKAQYSIVAVQV